MRIVVAGFLIGLPFAGYTWQQLHYLIGLRQLGHEVYFLEDTWDDLLPYDPVRQLHDVDSSYGRAYIERVFDRFGLAGRWAYYSQFEDRFYGLSRGQVATLCAGADLFLNVAGLVPLRPLYRPCRRKAVIDLDPAFTQLSFQRGGDRREAEFREYDACFTLGVNIGRPGCPIPTARIAWRPTVQPVVMDLWPPQEETAAAFTTVASWASAGKEITFRGTHYTWRKSDQFARFLDLPSRAPVPFELALAGVGAEAQAELERAGWIVRDGARVSRDPWAYRSYLSTSYGEFTVAKDMNIALRSGWFSDRSACYLAAGRPVITQDTGFASYLPCGKGLFAFESMEDILAAIEAIRSDYAGHRKAAREIAEEYFDARKVLTALLADLGA